MAPESVVFDSKARTRWTYRCLEEHPLVPVCELPEFTDKVLNTIESVKSANPREQTIGAKRAIIRGKIRDALAYVMKIDSVQHQYGSNGLVRFFAVLRDAGYTEAQAMAAAVQWNQSGKAVPPWSLDELATACSNTFAKEGPK